METRALQRKSERIEQVVARLKEVKEGADGRALEAYVRAFYRGVPPAELAGESPDTLLGWALSLWSFATTRGPGEPCVRVVRPGGEELGWQPRHSVIEIVNDDMPFLVDSVTAELQRREAEVRLVVHPILDVERDGKGTLTGAAAAAGRDGARRESWMQIQVRLQAGDEPEAVAASIESVLADVRSAVEDWKPCLAHCDAVAEELRSLGESLPAHDGDECASFLEWLVADNFIFLGYREYSFEGEGDGMTGQVVAGRGLGLLRDAEARVFDGMLGGGKLPADVRHFLSEPQVLRVTKANRRSTVHRPVLIDTIGVKRLARDGRVIGGRLFVGLFTSRAYSTSPLEIPLLRRKVRSTFAAAGVPTNTHDGKALMHILTSHPRDELFEIGEEELCSVALGILDLQERPRVALFARVDPFERFVSCLVFVPRDRLDTSLRMRCQEILTSAWRGTLAAFYTHVSDSPLARLQFYVQTDPSDVPVVDVDAIERALIEAGRSWTDRLDEALVAEHGEEEGTRLLRRYRDAFPASYSDNFDEHDAVADIRRVERALAQGDLALRLAPPRGEIRLQATFKVYSCGDPIPLSDVLPMLENMGFRARGELPIRLRPEGVDKPVWIREFFLESWDGKEVDLGLVRERFHEAFAQVWKGELESDGFNRLVLCAGLTAREVVVLRAYSRYLRQARSPFSESYVAQTLASRPGIARLLVDLFRARFDPARGDDAEARELSIVDDILAELEQVTNLDQDRIIRRFLELIGATLRTNWFQADAACAPKPWFSFKLDSGRIPFLPKPRPFREIFVYSPRVEAVHLRGGKVARGGLRWSDRPEDFRTEVLGLMKAQMVKNTVIVPVGSKGGFVCKRLPSAEEGREALMAEVIECYKTMIRGLLDLTDNLDGSTVVPPTDVVRHDEDDPYLVVAADKGTATFSDIANGVSAEYGYWLDDAFASGGSAGYDHKKMAITARGAWECVRRHFREVGKDIQGEPFTVVGVGDMAGDVFGNGMLLSRQIRLLGAFNHLHVFIDPDPDPEASWVERKRLYDLPRSSWADYDASLISEGGGVWERTRKSIPVSARMRELFGIGEAQITPNELIHAMLQADVELLWFGGIGTYVKASAETDADAGDRANDALRVDATQLRARVVGEGANLALTQRGRIEAARRGVRLNTDALDNSAGVDCSDHEVNIKILLGERERAGTLTRAVRDRVLEGMTDEVAELVLRDNYLQSQAITVAQQKGASLLDRLGRFMRGLEKEGRLDRALEFLPDDEQLAERLKEHVGLTRPELAVLLSYAKIVLFDELVASSFPDDPWMADELLRYFPEPLRKGGAAAIAHHRLRREIVATMATNGMLNRVGISFVHEMKEKTGLPAEDIARAYIVARDAFALRDLWLGIEALDNKVPAALQATMLQECSRLVEQVVVWLLREQPRPLEVPALIEAYRDGVAALAERLEELLSPAGRAALERRAQTLVDQGAPAPLARRVAGLEPLAPACDIVGIAAAGGVDVARAGQIYFAVGDRFGFDWLRRVATDLPADTAWEKLALSAVIDDLYANQGAMAASVLAGSAAEDSADTALDAWSAERATLVARTQRLVTELETAARPDLAMLTVATRRLTVTDGKDRKPGA